MPCGVNLFLMDQPPPVAWQRISSVAVAPSLPAPTAQSGLLARFAKSQQPQKPVITSKLFSRASWNLNDFSGTVNLGVAASTPPASYTLTVTNGSLSRATQVTHIVLAAGIPTLAASRPRDRDQHRRSRSPLQIRRDFPIRTA